MKNLSRFSLSNGIWFLKAYLLIPVISVAMSLFGFAKVYDWITKTGVDKSRRFLLNKQQKVAEKIYFCVEAACHYHFLRAQCLHRSLIGFYFLKQRGIRVNLCIGVTKDADAFQAHAWLEYEGMVLGESPQVQAVYSLLMRSSE